MITLKNLQDKVEERISDYMEFDIKELFGVSDYITIFGGSVRDSLADLEIHDIDILCMPDSAKKLRTFLHTKGYTTLDLYDIDTLNMYKGISLISEPWTLMNKNRKIIQIIRPTFGGPGRNNKSSEMEYQLAYYNLIKNVDLSCCGVFLENFGLSLRLREACKNSIIQCLSRTYIINEWSKMYNRNRTDFREYKLDSRGWKNLEDSLRLDKKSKLKKDRQMKLINLEFKPEYDYKIWTEQEYLNRPKKRKDDELPF
jgi:hypothetical protein